MDLKEIHKRLRQYEIRIRKALTNQMQGDFHSVFKGSGLEFDDVRQYQYGDDIRAIDWNVSAKGHGTYVKTFKEEKEQTVFFLLDVSASQQIGKQGRQKADVGKEICALLSFAAIKENSQVGLIGYSDTKELYVKPNKGIKHGYELFTRLFRLVPTSKGTNLARAMNYTLKMVKRKSVVIVVSDFIDDNYQPQLKALGRKHDLVVIHLSDPREEKLPRLGIIPLLDRESGRTLWVNTSWGSFKKGVLNKHAKAKGELERICRTYQANFISVRTDQDYVPKLLKLFKVRNKSRVRA